MRWLGRSRRPARRTLRTKPFDESALPDSTHPSHDAGVSEGLLLAEYATRMAIKNHIVVDALRAGHNYDPAIHEVEAAAMLRELATEQGMVAGRVDEELADASGLRGDARHPHDYRNADVENLMLRRRVALDLALALREKSESTDDVRVLVERSRGDAWNEIAGAIEAGMDAFTGVEALKADYERERPARLTQFLRRDLAALIEERTGY